jgi:hypothetical protein
MNMMMMMNMVVVGCIGVEVASLANGNESASCLQ